MPIPGQASSSMPDGSVAEHMQRAAEAIPAAAPPLAAGAQLLEPLARTMGATRASLLILNPHTAQLFMLAGLGVPPELVGRDLPSRPRSIADWVLRHQHGRLFQGEVREESIEGMPGERTIDSSLCLPILGTSGAIGVVNLARCSPASPFGEHDLAAVLQALPALGVALEGLRFRALAERFARQLQKASAGRGRSMIPEGACEARGWEFAFVRRPGLLESSDFADRIAHGDGGQTLLVADVRGDGVDAATAAAFTQGLFLAAGAEERSPVRLRNALQAELVSRLGAGAAPGCWIAYLATNGTLSSIVSGTAAPLWLPAGADEPQPLGGGPQDGGASEPESVRLLPGDLVVFASDAVHHAYDPARRGIARARLMEVLDSTRRQPVDQLARALCDGARENTSRPATPDDLAVFVLRYRPAA